MVADPERAIREEIDATIERAGFTEIDSGDIRIEVTSSLRRRFGDCRLIPEAMASDDEDAPIYRIRVAQRLFEEGNVSEDVEDADDEIPQWRDTVRHEVAHAAVHETHGVGVGHGPRWKEAARRAGAMPHATCAIGDDFVDADYVLSCPNECFTNGYLKRSKRIKQPWQYRCTECDRDLISYDFDNRPVDPTPGHCYVESIPWTSSDETTDASDPPYRLACPNGCSSRPYEQRSKRIKRPWAYACNECHTRLISYDAGDRPAEPEPGHCYVASIAWDRPRLTVACPNGCFENHHLTEPATADELLSRHCSDCDANPILYRYGERPAEPIPGTRYDEETVDRATGDDQPESAEGSGSTPDGSENKPDPSQLRKLSGLPERPLLLEDLSNLDRSDRFDSVIPAGEVAVRSHSADEHVVVDVLLVETDRVTGVVYDDRDPGWFVLGQETAVQSVAIERVIEAFIEYRGYEIEPEEVLEQISTAYEAGHGTTGADIESILFGSMS